MFPKYDISYDEFKDMIKSFSHELNYPFEKISIKKEEYKSESNLFIYYNAKYNDINKNHLDLFVKIVKDQNSGDVKDAKYTLELGFFDTPASFYFFHKIDDKEIPALLERWLSNCLKYIKEYKRTPFDYFFYDSPYLNYGREGDSLTTANLFKITLFGILNTNDVKQVWIARIRHIRKDDLYRSFTYAILPYEQIDWLIFPDAVGLDSGGARSGYEDIENSIKEAQKIGDIKIIDIDASIEEFQNKFEYLYPHDFELHHIEITLYEKIVRMKKDNIQLTEFIKEIQRIDEEIIKQEYMPALRDMRALIEGICKYICRTNKIQIKSDDPNINHLSSALLEKKIIDPHILSWFNAFNSIANETAHDIDSSKIFEMEQEIKNDLFETTIKLGGHLILQLYSKV
ncbi:MAG: hypothetical protein WA144_04340 [Candidatus Methanoperedens sp.]